MSNNKRPHKEIEDALEIDKEEEKDNDALLERLAKFKEMREDDRKKASEEDKDFIKETLRELALMGLHAGRVLEDEIEVNATGRDVECLASIMTATRDALKRLQDVELDEQKMEIEHKKLALKQSSSGPSKLTQNNMFVGSHSDMLKAMKELRHFKEEQESKIIEVEEEEEPE